MRLIRYEAEGRRAYGIVDGNDVEEVSGTPFEAYTRTGKRRAVDSVKLLIPVVPPTFYAAGLNYVDHLRVADPILGLTPANVPRKPDIGYRANNALIAHRDPIVIPKDATEKVQYEGELVAVVGKKARRLSEEEALSCVLGYTIGNDVSERTWQASDVTLWRCKNSDTFKPMGPWIDTDVDLTKIWTSVRLNGRTVSEFDTTNMVFGIATYISAMTRYVTLYPGDVIWMGTDRATENMKAGDDVEIEIEIEIEISGIGVLRNPVVAE